MTALKEQWQAQKRQRQQELVQRQQQVRNVLASYQQERQTKASQLRDDLSLFQLELQQETQDFLVRINQQRQTQAEQLTCLLYNFSQALQAQTAQFLATKAADRSLVAQQLAQDLSQFHHQLHASVASLRQELQEKIRSIQAEVQVLQSETQAFLSISHQHRIQVQKQQAQELAAFVTSLQVQVQDYLAELDLLRQDRVQQLQQKLQQSRDRRLNEVNALFQQFSRFRAELQQYRVDLSQLVWQTAPYSMSPQPDTTQAKAAQPQTIEPEPSVFVSQSIVAPTIAAITASTSTPTAKTNGSEAPTEILERVFPEDIKGNEQSSEQLEQEIYRHIRQIQGARLTEIESALSITRFQTVDALRSLIKKGLITQRDRVYLIQEEVSP